MTAHCLKCKKKTGDVRAVIKPASSGKPMYHANCADCGGKKCRMMTKDDLAVQGGSAFTDFFTKSIPTFFKKTLPSGVRTAAQKAHAAIRKMKPSEMLNYASYLPVVGTVAGVASKAAAMAGHGARAKRK